MADLQKRRELDIWLGFKCNGFGEYSTFNKISHKPLKSGPRNSSAGTAAPQVFELKLPVLILAIKQLYSYSSPVDYQLQCCSTCEVKIA